MRRLLMWVVLVTALLGGCSHGLERRGRKMWS